MKKGLGVVVLLVAIGLLATPYAIGLKIEQETTELISKINQQQTQLEFAISKLDRGWFGTDMTVSLHANGKSVVASNHIRHGLLPSLQLAVIQGELVSDVLPEELKAFFETSPLTYEAKVSLSGKAVVTFHSPSFEFTNPDQVAIQWGGFEGVAEDLGNGVFGVDFIFPSLTVNDGSVRLAVQDAFIKTESMQWESLADKDRIDNWHSFAQIGVKRLLIDEVSAGNRFELGSLITAESRVQPDKTLSFNYDLAVTDLSVDVNSAAHWQTPQTGLNFAVNGLKVAPIAEAIEAIKASAEQIQSMPADSEEERQLMLQQMSTFYLMQALPDMIQGPASLTVALPKTETNHGNAELKVKAQLGEYQGEPLLYQRLTVDGAAFMDLGLLESLINLTNDPGEAWGQINQLVAQTGFFVVEDDKLKTSVQLDPHSLVINGEPVPDELRRAMLGIQ